MTKTIDNARLISLDCKTGKRRVYYGPGCTIKNNNLIWGKQFGRELEV